MVLLYFFKHFISFIKITISSFSKGQRSNMMTTHIIFLNFHLCQIFVNRNSKILNFTLLIFVNNGVITKIQIKLFLKINVQFVFRNLKAEHRLEIGTVRRHSLKYFALGFTCLDVHLASQFTSSVQLESAASFHFKRSLTSSILTLYNIRIFFVTRYKTF